VFKVSGSNPVAATKAIKKLQKNSSLLEIILKLFYFKMVMKYVSSTFYFGAFWDAMPASFHF
jgi:hypothetical protein